MKGKIDIDEWTRRQVIWMEMKEELLVREWEDVKNVIAMEQNKGEVSCDHRILYQLELWGPDCSVPEFVGTPVIEEVFRHGWEGEHRISGNFEAFCWVFFLLKSELVLILLMNVQVEERREGHHLTSFRKPLPVYISRKYIWSDKWF